MCASKSTAVSLSPLSPELPSQLGSVSSSPCKQDSSLHGLPLVQQVVGLGYSCLSEQRRGGWKT